MTGHVDLRRTKLRRLWSLDVLALTDQPSAPGQRVKQQTSWDVRRVLHLELQQPITMLPELSSHLSAEARRELRRR